MEAIIIGSLTGPEVPPDMNTNGHCFLCLKEESWSWGNANPKGIGGFRTLLCYLAGFDHNHVGGVEGGGGGDLEEEIRSIGDGLPPLCMDCYDKVADLHGAHQELVEAQRRIQEKAGVVRECVLKTTGVGVDGGFQNRRDKFMEGFNNSELPLEQISSVSSLILKVHERIISEGDAPLRFPSFLPNAEPELDFGESERTLEGEDGPSKKRRRHSPEPTLEWSNQNVTTIESDAHVIAEAVEGDNSEVKNDSNTDVTQATINTAGMNVCGVPVDPSANYVMITTNVTDPETGAVTVQPVLLNVAQLIPQVQAAFTPSGSLPPATSNTAPSTIGAPPPKKKRKRRKAHHINPATAYSHYEIELRLQLCDICNERIPLGPHGTSHIACHIGAEYVNYCRECEYSYISPFRLREFHISRHLPCTPDPTLIFQCDLCAYQAEWMQDLRKHFKDHEKDPLLSEKYNCPLCPLKFKSKKMLQLHLGDRHVFLSKTTGRQTCDICKSYFNVKEIEDHLLTHGVTLPFRCKMCLSMFSNLDSLIKHQGYAKQKGHHEKVCHLCDTVTKFMTLTALRTHYFDTHGLGSKFICELCNDEFLSKDKWDQHQDKVHTEKKPNSTSKAGVIEGAPDGLIDETPSKKKKPPKRSLACPECGDARIARYQLLKHRIEKHGHPRLTCSDPHCSETFTSEKDKKLHVASVHQGYTVLPPKSSMCPLRCEDCGAEFSDRGKLNGHRKVHSTERPFACELCDSKYKSRHALNLHMMYTHLKMEKKRRFLCDICDKGFFTEKMLRSHKLIHTGERPYACQHCGQRFRQEVALWTHEKSHAKLGDKFRPKGEMERKKCDENRKDSADLVNMQNIL